MTIFIDRDVKIICQGFTGKSGTYHIKKSLEYNTNIVGGVTPGKGKICHLGLPVFNSVREAVIETGAKVSVIFVPALYCKDSIIEAINAKLELIVCITEGIPILDMIYIKNFLYKTNTRLIGPNSPGFVIPNVCRVGIMPCEIHKSGVVGIVSRSGTLTYEAIRQTSLCGLGQSVSVGIGGDPIIGSNFIDILKMFNSNINTKIVLLIGEIGGNLEEDAANFIKYEMNKPVVAYISGLNAPIGKKMGHAGAIVCKKSGNAMHKINILKKSGIIVVESLMNIGAVLSDVYKESM